jgi:hypothetical protein
VIGTGENGIKSTRHCADAAIAHAPAKTSNTFVMTSIDEVTFSVADMAFIFTPFS